MSEQLGVPWDVEEDTFIPDTETEPIMMDPLQDVLAKLQEHEETIALLNATVDCLLPGEKMTPITIFRRNGGYCFVGNTKEVSAPNLQLLMVEICRLFLQAGRKNFHFSVIVK